jgi:hypothetical protein
MSQLEQVFTENTRLVSGVVDSDPIWFDDWTILYRDGRAVYYIPADTMTLQEKANALLRLSFYVGLLLALLKNDLRFVIYAPLFTAAFTLILIKMQPDRFANYMTSLQHSPTNIHNEQELRRDDRVIEPTVDNPMMNANLITDDRDKPSAPKTFDNETIQQQMDDTFYTNLYRDVGDIYGRNNGQREFYQMPVTDLTGNQTAFAKWCYATGPTCKEKSSECVAFTN